MVKVLNSDGLLVFPSLNLCTDQNQMRSIYMLMLAIKFNYGTRIDQTLFAGSCLHFLQQTRGKRFISLFLDVFPFAFLILCFSETTSFQNQNKIAGARGSSSLFIHTWIVLRRFGRGVLNAKTLPFFLIPLSFLSLNLYSLSRYPRTPYNPSSTIGRTILRRQPLAVNFF